MLVGMQDVRVMAQQELGDGRDQAFLVGADDEQDGGIAHGGSEKRERGDCNLAALPCRSRERLPAWLGVGRMRA
jgi:hypothetical protein